MCLSVTMTQVEGGIEKIPTGPTGIKKNQELYEVSEKLHAEVLGHFLCHKFQWYLRLRVF